MIEQITTTEGFIEAYPYMKKIPFVPGTTDRFVLASCLLNNCNGLKLTKDSDLCGYVFFSVHGDVWNIAGIWCENHFEDFKDQLFDYAKSMGCRMIEASTVHNEGAYAKLTGMDRVFTVFKKDLGV